MKLFEIRNPQGQYLATYRAKTAQIALQRLIADDRSVGSAFRRSVRPSRDLEKSIVTEVKDRA